MLSSERKSAWE